MPKKSKSKSERNRNHSWNPPPPVPPLPLLKGRTFQKLSHLGRVRNFLLERGNKSEKGGYVEMDEGVAIFLLPYSSITFTVFVRKVRFPLLLFESSVF